MIRRFLIAVLIFLIAVLVAADRLGAIVAAHVVAGKVQTDEHLPNRPSASIGGFPFITQALRGKYNDVTIGATNLPVDGVSVTNLTVHLHGVHIKLSKVFHDSVSQVPVDSIDGTAVIAFADINTYLSDHHPAGQDLSFPSGAGHTATVVDKLRVAGRTVELRGVAAVSLRGNVIEVSIRRLTKAVAGGVTVSTQFLQHALSQLHISFPLTGLPFRIRLRSVSFTSTGISVTGSAQNVVLGSAAG